MAWSLQKLFDNPNEPANLTDRLFGGIEVNLALTSFLAKIGLLVDRRARGDWVGRFGINVFNL